MTVTLQEERPHRNVIFSPLITHPDSSRFSNSFKQTTTEKKNLFFQHAAQICVIKAQCWNSHRLSSALPFTTHRGSVLSLISPSHAFFSGQMHMWDRQCHCRHRQVSVELSSAQAGRPWASRHRAFSLGASSPNSCFLSSSSSAFRFPGHAAVMLDSQRNRAQ